MVEWNHRPGNFVLSRTSQKRFLRFSSVHNNARLFFQRGPMCSPGTQHIAYRMKTHTTFDGGETSADGKRRGQTRQIDREASAIDPNGQLFIGIFCGGCGCCISVER